MGLVPASIMGLVVGLLLGTVAGCGLSSRAATASGDTSVTLDIGGLRRDYLIHRPASGAGRLPAVLAFHGGGGDAAGMATMTGFDQLADRNGFVAVYPDGYQRSWNDGRGNDTRAGAAAIDDVAFVSAVIDRIVAADGVDPDRVYATGLSNGAMLTEYLGCALGGKLAAIAPVAGELPAADLAGCAPAHQMPVLEVHGTADPIVPYGGGVVRHTSGNFGGPGHSPVLSVQATQQLWRTRDGCGPATEAVLPTIVADGTSVTTWTAHCAGGTRVELYSVTGGGHTWPDGPQYLPKLVVGPVSHQFSASDLIWEFCAGFTRRA
jgi:polyhydroxybutyrate depolymerase